MSRLNMMMQMDPDLADLGQRRSLGQSPGQRRSLMQSPGRNPGQSDPNAIMASGMHELEPSPNMPKWDKEKVEKFDEGFDKGGEPILDKIIGLIQRLSGPKYEGGYNYQPDMSTVEYFISKKSNGKFEWDEKEFNTLEEAKSYIDKVSGSRGY